VQLRKDTPGFQQVPHSGAEHPIFTGVTPVGMMSGDEPRYPPLAPGGHEGLKADLQAQGLKFEETQGRYGSPERSLIIHGPTREQMFALGKKYGQESVIHSQNGKHQLIYTNGENEGKHHPSLNTYDYWHPGEELPEDYYTKLPNQGAFRLHFDFNQLHHEPLAMPATPAPLPAQAPITKYEIGNKVYKTLTNLVKAYGVVPNTESDFPAPGAAKAAPQPSPSFNWLPHPHAYDWHDAHTEHNFIGHGPGGVLIQTPQLTKHSLQKNASAQSIAFGTHGNGPSNLQHYNYSAVAPNVDKLVADHGFQTYSGHPDHGRKNYNTKHLFVAQTGDPNTDSYRKVHELAHALTHGEVNSTYGEGKRQGKLGHHRTLKEALRAVHWEHLAAHKQRELNKQLGIEVPEETFNRELNTIMHDALHRLVHGHHTDLAGNGFQPHSHKVPLETALGVVRETARNLGLQGENETLAKAEGKMSTEQLLEHHVSSCGLDDATDRRTVKRHLIQHHGLDEMTAHRIVNHPNHAALGLDDEDDRKTLAHAIDKAKTKKSEDGLSVDQALGYLHTQLQKRIDDFAQSALELRKRETEAKKNEVKVKVKVKVKGVGEKEVEKTETPAKKLVTTTFHGQGKHLGSSVQPPNPPYHKTGFHKDEMNDDAGNQGSAGNDFQGGAGKENNMNMAENKPKKVNALDPAEREKECTNHHFSYSGKMPNTGVLRCTMCGTRKDDIKKSSVAADAPGGESGSPASAAIDSGSGMALKEKNMYRHDAICKCESCNKLDKYAKGELQVNKGELAKKSPPGRKEEVEKLKAKGLPASEAFGIAWKQQNEHGKPHKKSQPNTFVKNPVRDGAKVPPEEGGKVHTHDDSGSDGTDTKKGKSVTKAELNKARTKTGDGMIPNTPATPSLPAPAPQMSKPHELSNPGPWPINAQGQAGMGGGGGSGSPGTGGGMMKAGMPMGSGAAPSAPKLPGMKPMKQPGMPAAPKLPQMPKLAAPVMGGGTPSPVAKAALEKAGPVALGQRSIAARTKFGERTQAEQAAKLPGVRASVGHLMDQMLAPKTPVAPAPAPMVPHTPAPQLAGVGQPVTKPAQGVQTMTERVAARMPAGPSAFTAPPAPAKPKLPGVMPQAAAPSVPTMNQKAAAPKPTLKNETPTKKMEYGLSLSELGTCALCKKAEHHGRCM
jgi:hypothetical protein